MLSVKKKHNPCWLLLNLEDGNNVHRALVRLCPTRLCCNPLWYTVVTVLSFVISHGVQSFFLMLFLHNKTCFRLDIICLWSSQCVSFVCIGCSFCLKVSPPFFFFFFFFVCDKFWNTENGILILTQSILYSSVWIHWWLVFSTTSIYANIFFHYLKKKKKKKIWNIKA